MQSIEADLGDSAAAQLETIFGSDERSWRRRLKGERTADGETLTGLILSRLGPRMLLAASERLTPEDYATFWNEMFDALAHARLRQRQNKGPF